ncbi:MAG: hypothetical protein RLZZ175_634 [Bacteroidota bacterium]
MATKSLTLNIEEFKNIGNIELLAKQTVEGFITGLHRSPYHGFSVEFAEHKIYNPGESTRHIDWKVFAKTDKLFTKRYEEETNLRCQLLLDISGSMWFPVENNAKLIWASWMVATMATLLQNQRDAVGLTTFSNEINSQSAVKSTQTHLRQLYQELQQLTESKISTLNKTTSIADTLHIIAEKMGKRALVVLFSDMFEQEANNLDGLMHALQHLRHNGHEVLIFHVYDGEYELDFNFPNKPTWFTDIETGNKIKLNPSLYKEQYQNAVKDLFVSVMDKCTSLKIDFVEADIRQDASIILNSFLAKRSRMR